MTDQAPQKLQDISPQMAAAMLQFYAEAGVVDLLEDDPVDRYADTIKQLEERKAKKAAQMDQMLSANKARANNIRPQGNGGQGNGGSAQGQRANQPRPAPTQSAATTATHSNASCLIIRTPSNKADTGPAPPVSIVRTRSGRSSSMVSENNPKHVAW